MAIDFSKEESYTIANIKTIDNYQELFEFGNCANCRAECITSLKGLDIFDKLKAIGINDFWLPTGIRSDTTNKLICTKCTKIESENRENREKPKAVRKVIKTIKSVYVCPICDTYRPTYFKTKAELELHLNQQHESWHIKRELTYLEKNPYVVTTT